MSIKIPLTQGVQGGSLGRGISASAGTQGLQALSQLGETVAKVGDKLFDTQVKLERVINEKNLSKLKSRVKRETAAFQNSIINDHDPSSWQRRYREHMGGVLSDDAVSGLSEEALEEWKMWKDDYLSGEDLRVARDATMKELKEGELQLKNSVREYNLRGDFNSSREEIKGSSLFSDAQKESWLLNMDGEEKKFLIQRMNEAEDMKSFEEICGGLFNKGLISIEEYNETMAKGFKNFQRKDIEESRAIDPFKTKHMIEQGEYDLDPVEMEVELDKTQKAIIGKQRQIFSDAQEMIINNPAISDMEIEEATGKLTAKSRERLLSFAEDRRDKDLQDRVASPEYQSVLVGNLTKFALSFDPANIKNSEEELAFLTDLDSVKNKHEKERIRGIYNEALGKEVSKRNAAFKGALGVLDQHYKALEGRVESPYQEDTKTVRDFMRGGYLDDVDKLVRQVGFSKSQAKTIKNQKNMEAKADMFKEYYKRRASDGEGGSETTMKLARMLGARGAGALDHQYSKEKHAADGAITAYDEKLFRLRQQHGYVVQELTEYVEQHPSASYGDIMQKAKELAGEEVKKALGKYQGDYEHGTAKKQAGRRVRVDVKLSNYGYASDSTPDSFSKEGIGHASNALRDGQSVAISKNLARQLGLKKGAALLIRTTKGDRIVTYDDTVPSTDKRTGPLPPTIDIYRKKHGSNKWGGRVQGVSVLFQGRDGLSGRAYTNFSKRNYERARKYISGK